MGDHIYQRSIKGNYYDYFDYRLDGKKKQIYLGPTYRPGVQDFPRIGSVLMVAINRGLDDDVAYLKKRLAAAVRSAKK